MIDRKQILLKAYRRRKRVIVSILAICALLLAVSLSPWAAIGLLVVAWVAHEAWFADHLFYRPGEDYNHSFPAQVAPIAVNLMQGKPLILEADLPPGDTLILEVRVRSGWAGYFVDPFVLTGDDRQDFERGASGRRYLNLSGQRERLLSGKLTLTGKRCRLASTGQLWVMDNPDFAQQRMMIIAPHADDAELAAFGQYQRCQQASIVTVTQGEIEAEAYQTLGLDAEQAARLKGRLRTWDSLAAPLWGGVPQARCAQLGYFCLQLSAMAAEPARAFGSRASGESDIRPLRVHNPLPLPGDQDGEPRWSNLVADLAALIEHWRPEVIVTPHPELDPHADHVATTRAVFEAIEASQWKPTYALYYANHLHDNDRWPMGPANTGIALPPAIEPMTPYAVWSPTLSAAAQIDKTMALRMQHDLQGPLPLKRQVRRWLQTALAGRKWPATGENEFFRKGIRRHELFWIHYL